MSARLRAIFSAEHMVYFDHNATTPLLPEARDAWLDAAARFIGNASSPHRVGARADRALHQAREELAGLLGCDAHDIIWTSGATESNNTVLHHVAHTLTASAGVWVSAIEHPCVLKPARHYFGARCRTIPVTRQGLADLDWLKAALKRNRPGMIALMAANNETGVLQPWREVSALCEEHEVPFLCDAAQWLGKLPAAGLGACSFVTGSAHKFGGPKGVGFLKCPSATRLTPLLRGGPQEEGRRAGTENVPAIVSMLAALRRREAQIATTSTGLTDKAGPRDRFIQALLQELPGSDVLGVDAPRLWNTVSALMPEAGCRQRWVVKLDKLGFAVSTGSACASGTEEPSHVLAALGHGASEAGRALRFSSGWETTPAEWEALLAALVEVWQGMQADVRPGSSD